MSANTRTEAHHFGDQALPLEKIKILVDVHDPQDKSVGAITAP